MTSEENRSERSKNVESWPSDEEYRLIKDKFTQDHHSIFADYISNQEFSRDWTKEELRAAAALLSRFFFGVYMIARRNKFEDRDYQLLYSENLEEQGIAHFVVDEDYPQGVFRINIDELKEFVNLYFDYLSARSYNNIETILDHYELAGVEEAAHCT